MDTRTTFDNNIWRMRAGLQRPDRFLLIDVVFFTVYVEPKAGAFDQVLTPASGRAQLPRTASEKHAAPRRIPPSAMVIGQIHISSEQRSRFARASLTLE